MIDPTIGAVVASGLAAVLIGMIWYHPKVFGGVWMRLSGITPEMQERGKKRMPIMGFFGFLAAMLVAYVMTYLVNAQYGFYNWIGGLQFGIWIWLGFVAPILLGQVLWEQKPFRVYLINALYWLVTLLVMAQFIVFAYGLEAMMSINTDSSADTGAYVAE